MEYVDEVFERLQIRLIAWEQVVEALMEAGAPKSFYEYFELTLEHSKGGVKRVDKPSEGWACRVL